jgi:RNA-directed DNA polymerase
MDVGGSTPLFVVDGFQGVCAGGAAGWEGAREGGDCSEYERRSEQHEGFDFRRLRSIGRQVWRAHYTPKMKKRTALLRKLKDVFRRFQSQPVDRVVQPINPILRGWVNYFAIGHSSECFAFIRDWVEKKIRRPMGRSRNRRGFGWKRWSRRWLYEEPKLFNGYRVRRLSPPKALPAR